MKNIANVITGIRIPLSIAILFTEGNQPLFLTLYAICGITDCIDGPIARRTHTESEFGAKLDSISDAIFMIAVLLRLGMATFLGLPRWIALICALILLLKGSAYLVGLYRFHRFISLHTIMNKITGGALFLIVFFLNQNILRILLMLVGILGILAAIDELICEIRMQQCNRNIKWFGEASH